MTEIPNFPRYRVDKNGDVFNDKGVKLRQEVSSNGYSRVSLSNDREKHKRFLVHRLVAEAYIPNPNNYPQVNHKDFNKQNNRVDNLEWCTPLQNLTYGHVIEKASIAKFQKVLCVNNGEIFDSIKDACEKYDLHHSNIVACCNGRRHTCGGLTWSYLE